MTNYPWAPPITDDSDIETLLAALQPHMRAMAKTSVDIEDSHDMLHGLMDAMGGEVTESICTRTADVLAGIDEAINRGRLAVWS